jgi:copper transport protein
VTRRVRRVSVVLALSLLILGLTAGPAFAHAELQGTDPGANAALTRSPKAITLDFNEPVEVKLGGVRVFDSRAKRVRVSLSGLERDTYVVTWRVVSADSHPVRGAFTFSVGNGTLSSRSADSLAARLLSNQGGSTAVGVVYAIARFLVFLGLALLVGGVAFLFAVWPSGRSSRVARILLWTGLGAALVGSLAGFALEGPYSAALGLADALKPSLWSDVFATRFGKVWIARAVLLVVAAPLVSMLVPRRGPAVEHPLPGWWTPAIALLGAALVTTPALAGHASSGPLVPIAIPADAAHVAGMSLWLGGLAMLLFALLPSGDARTLRDAVPRYSQLALMSVAVIVVTGVFQSFRQVDRLNALLDTDYGNILAVKVVIFLLLVVAAAVSRDVVNRRWRIPEEDLELQAVGARETVGVGGSGTVGPAAGVESSVDAPGDAEAEDYPEGFILDEDTARRRMRGALLVEVVFAIAVLVATSLLVNAPPVRGQDSGPYIATLRAGAVNFDTVVTPATRGLNELHLTALSPSGTPADVLSMSAQLSLPSEDIAPIDVPLVRAGPGHYLSNGFSVPITGDWRLTVRARTGETDEVAAAATVTIR